MREWLTYAEALDEFGADRQQVRRWARGGRVRFEQRGTVLVFSAEDLARAAAVGAGEQVTIVTPAGDDSLQAARDLAERLANRVADNIEAGRLGPGSTAKTTDRATTDTAHAERVEAEVWFTYSVLWERHGVARGWLDRQVHGGRVRQHRERGGPQLYSWNDIVEVRDGQVDGDRPGPGGSEAGGDRGHLGGGDGSGPEAGETRGDRGGGAGGPGPAAAGAEGPAPVGNPLAARASEEEEGA